MNRTLHRFAFFTAVMTGCLIFLGGLVTSTGSGLSVPDWPTTYGQNMFTYPIDQWVGGIKYEHGHRLFASFVGFLTVVLAVLLWRKEQRRWVQWMGYGSLIAVITQGVLGGLTVLFLLPVSISVAHGMLAQTFFCAVSVIALATSTWWHSEEHTTSVPKSLQWWTIGSIAVIYLQLAFGAIMRHSGAGLAVPDLPLAYGQIFPSLSPEHLELYQDELIRQGIKWSGDRGVEAYQIVLHLLHRYWAVVVATVVTFTAVRLRSSAVSAIRKSGTVLLALILIQFTLGLLTVLTHREAVLTSIHVVTGAVVLVTTVLALVIIARTQYLSRIAASHAQ